MIYDVIIVGGGTAGCVLARRLTDDLSRSVLLLEAGPDYPGTDSTPAEILDAKTPPMSHDWGYVAADRGDSAEPVLLPRGKLVGGSSATNYAFAMRTRPADHDEWAEMGLDGWGWRDVLPLYRDMETDTGGDEIWHGRNGLFRVTRPSWETVAPTAKAFADACRQLSIPVVDDVNAPAEPGFGIVPRNEFEGIRENLAMTYLNPVRERPNLEVRGNTLIDRVLVEGKRAVGVVLDSGVQIRGRQVILSAGAFNTPTILMRSGIGAREDLEPHGIKVIHERRGVGRNLMEHPVFWNIYAAHPSSHDAEAIFQSCLSYKVRDQERDYDLHLIPSSLLAAEDIPPQYVPPIRNHPTGFDFVIFVSNVRPVSRGQVTLASASASVPPMIDLNLYGAAEDAEIVAEGVRIARRLVEQTPLSDFIVEERAPGAHVTDDRLVAAVKRSVTHYNHPSGTCRMGVADDPDAVVDKDGRVIGIDGLSVIDASIIPRLPRVPINPTVVLIAEKLAASVN